MGFNSGFKGLIYRTLMVKEMPSGALKSSSYPRSLLLVDLTTLGVIKVRPIYGRGHAVV